MDNKEGEPERAKTIVKRMYDNDAFSKWMGIEITSIEPGNCSLTMVVRKEMLNGFSIAHGGITYSLADSALAFASNSHGVKSVSIETSISHLARVSANDVLTARATEIRKGKKNAWYEVHIRNQDDLLVAHFKGVVYRTGEEWKC